MFKRLPIIAALYLSSSVALADVQQTTSTGSATVDDLVNAAAAIMSQIDKSRTLTQGISYYASVGGIAPDGTMSEAEISQAKLDAYNNAIASVQADVYYNTQMLLEDEHDNSMADLSVAIDNLVDATTVFATVAAVGEMAAEADTTQEQLDLQEVLAGTDMSLSQDDVDAYNNALAGVEQYAQEAAGFLAASKNTDITGSTDNYLAQNNTNAYNATQVTYDATGDILFMEFAAASNFVGIEFTGYLFNDFKTVEDIYNTGIAYTGGGG